MLKHNIKQYATVYLFQKTNKTGWSTSPVGIRNVIVHRQLCWLESKKKQNYKHQSPLKRKKVVLLLNQSGMFDKCIPSLKYNKRISFHKKVSYLTCIVTNLMNHWCVFLLMVFNYQVIITLCRRRCQFEQVKLVWAPYICRKAVFLSISLFFSIIHLVIPTTEVASPGHRTWLCTWPPTLLLAPGMGRILKHLPPLWVIAPEAQSHVWQTLSPRLLLRSW